MHSVWRPAPKPLSGVLAGIWSVRAGDEADLSARVLPDGSTFLVFHRDGATLRSRDVEGCWASTAVCGPRSGPLDFTLGASDEILIVQLQPAGAARVLGVAMSSLADACHALDDVVGALPGELLDGALGGAGAGGATAIERWLLARVRERGSSPGIVDAMIRTVDAHAGGVRIDALAADFALSRRHLGRIMNDHIGYAPKLFARITRFDHAVSLGRSQPRTPWARIAIDAGYSDQAHMTREFAALGGVRPSDLRGPAAALIW